MNRGGTPDSARLDGHKQGTGRLGPLVTLVGPAPPLKTRDAGESETEVHGTPRRPRDGVARGSDCPVSEWALASAGTSDCLS